MGMKLFEALFEIESGISKTYIAAETIDDAKWIAQNEVADYSLNRISEAKEIGKGWIDEIPLGSVDGKTCGQIMEEIKRHEAQEEFFNKHQLKLFEEVQ